MAGVKQTLWQSRRPILVGVVHLRPLPGSPRWGGNMSAILLQASRDARSYVEGGVDALIVENFGDLPFYKDAVPPETVAAMAVAAERILQVVDVPIGFNVLRNDARAGLALAGACGGTFLRVNVHAGAMLTDQGLIEGRAAETLRHRPLLAPQVQIWADVHVKHALPLGNQELAGAARDTWERGLADALIVSGTGTGWQTSRDHVAEVRKACPKARLLVGSGVTEGNLASYLGLVDGFIVGSSLKREGNIEQPVDAHRVRRLRSLLSGRRSQSNSG